MVTPDKLNRKTVRKVELRLAHSDQILREKFQHDVLRDRQRGRLAAIIGTPDESLLDELVSQGFCPENLSALRYAPIAEIAWASGQVTEREQIIAVTPIFSSELLHEVKAVELFRSWLAQRPSEALSSLWERYTTDLLNRCENEDEKRFGQHLCQLATRVALASGGLLNQGDICGREQRILDRIAQVYGLTEVLQ